VTIAKKLGLKTAEGFSLFVKISDKGIHTIQFLKCELQLLSDQCPRKRFLL